MKKIFHKNTILVLVLALLSSCQNLFNDPLIKTNPNAVSAVDVPTLMSGTLLGLGQLHEDTDVRIAYMWSGQLTGESRQHLQYAQYQVTASLFSFGNPYQVAGQARLLQTEANAIKDARSKGIGRVIEALVIAKMACLYGDVPYAQAFDLNKYPTPVFDKQLDVYAALQSTLDSAIINLSAPTGIDLSAGDFIFGGNPQKWTAVANTLKARLYLHLADYPNAIKYASLGVNSIANDALMPHGTSQLVDINLNYDFFYNVRPGDTGFNTPAFLPTFMQNRSNSKTNETALYSWFFLLTGTSLDGNPNGFFAPNAFQPIISYYENQLILAEAYARTSDLANALIALNSVRGSLNTGYINGNTFPATGRQYDPYVIADFGVGGLANPNAYPDTQSALLYEIIAEKYIVTLSQYESYNDVRRLAKATPLIQLGIQPIVTTPSGTIAERFIYPQTEINVNPNVPKVNGQVADQFQKLTIWQ